MIKEKYVDVDGQVLTKSTYIIGGIYYTNEYGQKHRLDGPAFIGDNGYQAWYKNDKRHREDGPAKIWSDGSEFYYLDGKKVSKRDVDMYWIKQQINQ